MTLKRSRNFWDQKDGSQAVHIELAFDLLCPWTYIMKHRLERIAEAWESPLALSLRGLEMNPGMPTRGMPRPIYDRARCGNSSLTKLDKQRLCEAGRALGLNIDYYKISSAPNTNAAHQLIHFAGNFGLRGDALERLLEAYFVEGRDIGRQDVLISIGTSLGLPSEAVEGHLKAQGSRASVAEESRALKARGVRRIPTVIVAGAVLTQGPMEESELVRAIGGAIEAKKAQGHLTQPSSLA